MNNNTVLNKFDIKFLLIGSLLLIAGFVGSLSTKEVFFQAYFLGFTFVVGLPLGASFVMLIHYLTHGSWGFAIRKVGLAAQRTFPLIALFILPVFAGIKYIYPWTNPELVAQSHLLQHKAGYLSIPFFEIRAIFYIAVWIILSIYLERKSNELLSDASDEGRTKMQLIGGLSMLAFVFTTTFAAFDWLMALTPEWFSTIFGIFSIIGYALLAVTFMTAMSLRHVGMKKTQDMHDLGNLTLALIMLWMYMAFSQFFIIWSGNLPEEIIWYLPRTQGGWVIVAWVLAITHFFIPFFVLINRTVKRSKKILFVLCLWIIGMRFLDSIWTVLPNFCASVSDISWLHFAIPVGLFCIWYAFFIKQLETLKS
ncbi:MAG: hypothetical protein ACI9CF_000755 [Candidatus Omnitrophota bacterium]|jgi:hypothetical protein